MNRTTLCLLLSGMVIASVGRAAGQARQARKNPPELRVLERRIGVWETETTIEPGEWNPQGSKTKGIETTEWVLGGRFQQTKATNRPDGPDGVFLVTYDTRKKAFRAWFFNDEGHASEWVGKWDKAKQTFSLTWDSNGIRFVSHTHFIDKDNITWDLVAKNKEGKVLLKITVKLKRKK